jgi:opine dehydrogenase
MDNERINIAKELDISTRSVKRWHEDNYGVIGNNLYETLQKNSSYASIDAPRSLNSRYIYEDIPTGLVPLSEIGKAVGVKTPLMDIIIDLANYLLKTDFRLEGRNLVNLGLFGKNRDEIKMAFEE